MKNRFSAGIRPSMQKERANQLLVPPNHQPPGLEVANTAHASAPSRSLSHFNPPICEHLTRDDVTPLEHMHVTQPVAQEWLSATNVLVRQNERRTRQQVQHRASQAPRKDNVTPSWNSLEWPKGWKCRQVTTSSKGKGPQTSSTGPWQNEAFANNES